jgi:hypothetical protein
MGVHAIQESSGEDSEESSEEEEQVIPERTYSNGAIATETWPDGQVQFYKGAKGEERMVKVEYADGHVEHLFGAQGNEVKWLCVRPDGYRTKWEGKLGQERKVCRFPVESNDILIYTGERGKEWPTVVIRAETMAIEYHSSSRPGRGPGTILRFCSNEGSLQLFSRLEELVPDKSARWLYHAKKEWRNMVAREHGVHIEKNKSQNTAVENPNECAREKLRCKLVKLEAQGVGSSDSHDLQCIDLLRNYESMTIEDIDTKIAEMEASLAVRRSIDMKMAANKELSVAELRAARKECEKTFCKRSILRTPKSKLTSSEYAKCLEFAQNCESMTREEYCNKILEIEDSPEAHFLIDMKMAEKEALPVAELRAARKERKKARRQKAKLAAEAASAAASVAFNSCSDGGGGSGSTAARLERYHAAETEKNEHEAEERRRVRAAAEEAKAMKAPKPFTPAGPSHRAKPDKAAVDPLLCAGAAEAAREEARKKLSQERAHEHVAQLKSARERRLAEEAERENLRFIGSMIGSGRV